MGALRKAAAGEAEMESERQGVERKRLSETEEVLKEEVGRLVREKVVLEGRVRDLEAELSCQEKEGTTEGLAGVLSEGQESKGASAVQGSLVHQFGEAVRGRKKGEVAYEMRVAGVSWKEIGKVIGSRNALMAAMGYAKKKGLGWPIEEVGA